MLLYINHLNCLVKTGNIRIFRKEAAIKIKAQKSFQLNDRTLDVRDRYNEDVRLIVKNGKLYYSTV